MANIRLIRRRIRGAQSIQITRAMEMIATSRCAAPRKLARPGVPMTRKSGRLSPIWPCSPKPASCPVAAPPRGEENRHRDVSPDRGLAGGLITNLNHKVGNFILGQKASVTTVNVGRKGIDFMRRTGRDTRAEFSQLGDRPSLLDTLAISRIIINDYTSGFVDEVYVSYTKFLTTMVQTPVIESCYRSNRRFPASRKTPIRLRADSEEVLGALLPRFIEMEIYHAILESIASEQSARMVAMRSATTTRRN